MVSLLFSMSVLSQKQNLTHCFSEQTLHMQCNCKFYMKLVNLNFQDFALMTDLHSNLPSQRFLSAYTSSSG